MSYTFLNQQSKLSSLLGDSNVSTDDMFPTAQRQKELNRGEWQLAYDALDLLGYETGTVSSLTIAAPADWIKTHVLIINNYVITNDREISLTDWERYYNEQTSEGYYYLWPNASGTINLNFISSSVNGKTYKLYYFKKPTTELSSDSDVSLHPEQFREGPVYYAASELMRQIGKNEQSNQFRVIYEAIAQKAEIWAKSLYINKEYARPDFGPPSLSVSTTDTQGKGYIG